MADVEDASLSSKETRVVAEETTILVVDKVVNILVSSEKESLHQRVNEGNDDRLLEPVLKSNKDLLEGGSAGVEYVPGGNGVLTHKTASEVLLEDVRLVSDIDQVIATLLRCLT